MISDAVYVPEAPHEASKLFLQHPSDAGWMLEGWDGGRDFRNALSSWSPSTAKSSSVFTLCSSELDICCFERFLGTNFNAVSGNPQGQVDIK